MSTGVFDPSFDKLRAVAEAFRTLRRGRRPPTDRDHRLGASPTPQAGVIRRAVCSPDVRQVRLTPRSVNTLNFDLLAFLAPRADEIRPPDPPLNRRRRQLGIRIAAFAALLPIFHDQLTLAREHNAHHARDPPFLDHFLLRDIGVL
jgi:hypothetical protein